MRDALLSGLLPPAVVTISCRVADCRTPLSAPESALVARAVAKRRREFAAGRFCAHQALQQCGCDIGAIVADWHGAPCWPVGVVGSITHSSVHAAAAVAVTRGCCGIGIDIEALGRFTPAMAARVLLPEETAPLESAFGADWLCGATALFSAKESVYKCLYPVAGPDMRFRDARISLGRDETLTVALSPGLQARVPQGALLQGCWRMLRGEVVTGIVLVPAD